MEVETDLKEEGYKKKYKNRLQKIMESCLPDESYAAVKSTNLLNDDSYKAIQNILVEAGQWTDDLKKLEIEIKNILRNRDIIPLKTHNCGIIFYLL